MSASIAFTAQSALIFIAAAFSLLLAAASLLRRRDTIAAWCFCFGMVGLAGESLMTAVLLSETDVARLMLWHRYIVAARAFVSAIWLCFSVTYSRGNARSSLKTWSPVIALAALLPVIIL